MLGQAPNVGQKSFEGQNFVGQNNFEGQNFVTQIINLEATGQSIVCGKGAHKGREAIFSKPPPISPILPFPASA